MLRIEFLQRMRDHGHAIVQAGEQHIEKPAGPGPICRSPQPITGLRQKLVRKFDPRQVSKQDAMRVQGALGRAGRPRSVDHQRWLFAGGHHRRKVGHRARQERVEVQRVKVQRVEVSCPIGRAVQG